MAPAAENVPVAQAVAPAALYAPAVHVRQRVASMVPSARASAFDCVPAGHGEHAPGKSAKVPAGQEIQPLVQRVDRETPEEVILALTPSVEGDTTSLYLARLLKPFTTVSRIAYGLPMGSELEYADEVTLARAFEGRRRME